jgi:hypothetical protein
MPQPYRLSAHLIGQELAVKADGAVVWQGTLVPEVLSFTGPVGLRSDNAGVIFDFLAGEPQSFRHSSASSYSLRYAPAFIAEIYPAR